MSNLLIVWLFILVNVSADVLGRIIAVHHLRQLTLLRVVLIIETMTLKRSFHDKIVRVGLQ